MRMGGVANRVARSFSRRSLPADSHTLLSLFSTRSGAGSGGTRKPTRVFVLGINERRVTLHSQQCRALNLIWLLHDTGVLQGSDPVVVVGAGAGGLTAAAAAACKGHDVVVLNNRSEAMPQQRFARHRWLHPHIFDWPEKGWWKGDAKLPLLSWDESDAHRVRQTIINEFNQAPWRERVTYHSGVAQLSVAPADTSQAHASVCWSSDGVRQGPLKAKAVVLAVGFGSERGLRSFRPPVYWDSYWDDPGERWTSPGRTLISGGGDGGLTEVLHALLGEQFQHRMILDLAGARRSRGERRWVRQVRKQIVGFEQQWRHRQWPPAPGGERATTFFADLKAPGCDRLMREMLADRGGSVRNVTLLLMDDDFDVKSCAINRFLVARLTPRVELERNAKLDVDDPALRRTRGPYRPAIRHLTSCDGVTRVEVDSIVIRHGAQNPPIHCFKAQLLPLIDDKLFGGPAAPLVDATRRPGWPQDFYDQCEHASTDPSNSRAGLIEDPAVFAKRHDAVMTRDHLGIDPRRSEQACVVVGALEVTAQVGLALTYAGIERIARTGGSETAELLDELFGQERWSLTTALTIDDKTLKSRLPELTFAASEAASRQRGEDPISELRDLGHVRVGAMLGTASDQRLAEIDAATALARLANGQLPWLAAYGYASARFDSVESQLAFARQLIALVDDAEVPDSAREMAYTALRRSIRLLLDGGPSDPELWAAALSETGAYMARCVQDSAMQTFASDLASRWRMSPTDFGAVAALLGLRALTPDWPTGAGRWFLTTFGARARRRDAIRLDLLGCVARFDLPSSVAGVLAQFADAEGPAVAWSAVVRAEQELQRRSPAAAAHVDRMLAVA